MENEVKNKIFDFIYKMALRDAIMRKAYPWSKDDKEREEERKRIFGCVRAKVLTKEYVDALLRGEKPHFYNTASEIETAFKETKCPHFTFGNTQKLINMTVKYLYISAYQDTTRTELHEKFHDCHCPMDGIMVEKVIAKLIEKTNEEEVLEILKGHENNWRGFLREPWSRITSDKLEQYKLFQDIVKYLCGENLIPIEYDYEEWN